MLFFVNVMLCETRLFWLRHYIITMGNPLRNGWAVLKTGNIIKG
jgi:hypothetical protein